MSCEQLDCQAASLADVLLCLPEVSPRQELGSQPLGTLWLCRVGRAGGTYQAVAELPVGGQPQK